MVEAPRNSADTKGGSGGRHGDIGVGRGATFLRRQRTWMNGQTSASIIVQNSTRGMLT